MRFYIARVETRHFSFKAYGRTVELARNALRAGLVRHKKQYQVTAPRWVCETMRDSEVHPATMGRAYRDGVELA